jgi:hypothetical protein
MENFDDLKFATLYRQFMAAKPGSKEYRDLADKRWSMILAGKAASA